MKKLIKEQKRKRNRIQNIAFSILGIIAFFVLAAIINDPYSAVQTCGMSLAAVPFVLGGITLNEKEEAMYKGLTSLIESESAKYKEGTISKKELMDTVTEKINELAEKSNGFTKNEIEKIEAIVKAQGLELKSLKENKNPKEENLSLKSQIEKQLTEKFNGKSNEEKVSMLKGGLALNVKVASTMLLSNHITAGSPQSLQVLTGIDRIVRNIPFIRDFAMVGTTNSAVIRYVVQLNADGDAGWTAEGATKPLIDFDIKAVESHAAKVTDRAKVSMEMLEDIPLFAQTLQNELITRLELKEEDGLINGDGTNDQPVGVIDTASAYTLTSIAVELPNNYDALIAAYTQLLTLNHQPNAIFMNPIDAANMKLTKTSTGEYIMPPFMVQDILVEGVKIYPKNQIPQDFFLIGDFSKLEIYDYKPLTITFGFSGDDFEKNLTTAIAEKRMHVIVKDNQQNAFIYDQFSIVKAAIEVVNS